MTPTRRRAARTFPRRCSATAPSCPTTSCCRRSRSATSSSCTARASLRAAWRRSPRRSAGRFTPALAASGQAVILARRPGVNGRDRARLDAHAADPVGPGAARLRPVLARPRGPADAPHNGNRDGAAGRRRGRTDTVARASTHTPPASSAISTSQTQVVRPRWRAWAAAWIVPAVIGRRKLVEVREAADRLPSAATAALGAGGGQRLGDRGVDAAMDQPGRLLELVADRDLAGDPAVAELGDRRARSAGRSPARRSAAGRCSSARHDRRTPRRGGACRRLHEARICAPAHLP